MKKILAGIVICLFFPSISPVMAEDENTILDAVEKSQSEQNIVESTKQSLTANIEELLGEQKAQKYIQAIDAFIEKETSKEVLELVKVRLEKKLNNLKYGDGEFSEQEQTVYAIGSYIVVSLANKIYTLENADTYGTTSLSDEEIEKVQTLMNDVQFLVVKDIANMAAKGIENMGKSMRTFGNVEISVKANDENMGSLDSLIKLDEFESLSANLDSQLKGKLEIMLHALQNNASGSIDFELSTMIDMISKKSQDTYIGLKNTQVKYSDNPQVQAFVEKIQKVSDLGKYVHIGNANQEQTQQMMQDMLSSLEEVRHFFVDATRKETFVPFITFTPYKKVGNVYYLQSTGEQNCEMYRTKYPLIAQTLCEIQTENTGIMKLDVSNPEKYMYTEDFLTLEGKHTIQFGFSKQRLLSAKLSIIPTYQYAPDGFVSYEYADHIKVGHMSSYAKMNLNGNLSKANKLTSLQAFIDIPDSIIGNLSLKNHSLFGAFDIMSSKYNWEKDEYETQKVLSANIQGATSDSDSVSKLDIQANGANLAMESDALDMSFSYTDKNTYKGKIAYNNPLFVSGIWAFDYAIAGDFPRSFTVNENMSLELSRMDKKVVEVKLKANGSTSEVDAKQIQVPENVIELEDLYSEEDMNIEP